MSGEEKSEDGEAEERDPDDEGRSGVEVHELVEGVCGLVDGAEEGDEDGATGDEESACAGR